MSLTLIVMTLSGCLFMTEVSGRVVDARSTDANPGLGGVSVTVETDGSSYTTSTNSNGDWSALVWPGSSFTITYSKAGYYIPSMVTDLDSPVTTSSVVPAVPVSSTYEGTFDFILVWDGSQDLDMYFTFPDGDYAYNPATPATAIFNTPYEDTYNTVSSGFGPLSGSSRRVKYPSEGHTNASPIFTNRTSEGVENFNFNFPDTFLAGTGNVVYGDIPNGLSYGEPFNWNGIGEIYVESTSGTENVSDTGAILYVFQTYSDDNDQTQVALMGTYPAPLSTNIKGLSLVRLNIFKQGVQLTPDIKAFPGGSSYFRDITNNTVFVTR